MGRAEEETGRMTRVEYLRKKYAAISTKGLTDKGLAAQLGILTDISISLAMIAEGLKHEQHSES